MGCTHSRSPVHADFYTKKIEAENTQDSSLYRTSYVDDIVTGIKKWPEIDTLQQLYLKIFEEHDTNPMLGTRNSGQEGALGEYQWKTFGEIKEMCMKVGSALFNRYLVPTIVGEKKNEKFRFLGLYSKNRPEWLIVDIACCLYGVTVLPFYETLGHEAMEHVFDQTSVTTVFCAKDGIEKLLKGVEKGQYKSLKTIVSFDKLDGDSAEHDHIQILDWETFLKDGEEKKDLPEIKSDTVFTFNYTSGTTALPKAVVLTHGNVVAALGGYSQIKIKAVENLGLGDFYLSYLPLAHVLERMFCHFALFKGAAVGFFSGDMKKIKEDILSLKPTIFCTIPRMLQRFKDGITEEIDKLNFFKRKFTEHAINVKLDNLEDGGTYNHAAYDKLIFSKMRKALGGRVKLILTGGAPLSTDLGNFLKVAFACPIIEGYGLTETCGCGFLQRAEDTKTGRCGGPVPCVEVKLVDVPDMKYTSEDHDEKGAPTPRGEICIRGPCVFDRYYKNPEKTKEDIDEEQWFHTGDIGMMNPDGSFSIVDRKKNIFKLSQGEYVAPEKIENVYIESPYIAEAFVYGSSEESYLIGIIVPSDKGFSEIGKEEDAEKLNKDDKAKEFILEQATKIGKEKGLQGFEQIKKVYLEPNSFSKQDLITPSMKVKRQEAQEKYKETLEKLYSDKSKKPE